MSWRPILFLMLGLLLGGCIAPAVDVHKTIYIVGSPLCTSNCTNGNVRASMNSGTDIDAEVKQDTKLDTAVSGLP